jgi:thiamine biosynthesis lipoprotein
VTDSVLHAFAAMGTTVSFRVVRHGRLSELDVRVLVARAEAWFHEVETICSRFEPDSELRRLCANSGRPLPVSDVLYHAIEYSVAIAEASGGAFDPTVGRRMEALGFNRSWRSGVRAESGADRDGSASYRDVLLDPHTRTIALARPLLLDLGGVAKGFAIDLAVRELLPLGNFTIDAGGDLYLAGRNEHGEPWSVGIRHPREERGLIATLAASDTAVCTSGDYERREAGGEHHIMDPSTGSSAGGAASVTVLAPSATAADALATAAFVLGPVRGLELMEREGVDGLIFTRSLERFQTPLWDVRCAEAPSGTRA